MQRQDYLERLIEKVAAAVASVIGLVREKRFDEAERALDEAWTSAIGFRARGYEAPRRCDAPGDARPEVQVRGGAGGRRGAGRGCPRRRRRGCEVARARGQASVTRRRLDGRSSIRREAERHGARPSRGTLSARQA